MKSYTFHVSMPGTGRVWRKIEMAGEQTLAELHLAIQRAYSFDNDHLYSFFMSGRAWDDASEYRLPEGAPPWSTVAGDEEMEEEAETPVMEEEELSPEEREKALRKLFGPGLSLEEMEAEMEAFWARVEADMEVQARRDVRIVTLDSLELEEGQTFMYLFDYGDEWRFKVRVHAVDAGAPAAAEYPRLVEEVGEAPQQYGWGDEDEEWEE